MPSREAIAIPFVSNAGTVFLEILLHRVLFLLGAKATTTFLPRNAGHTFDSRGQSWHIHHSPRDPIAPGSAERQSRSRSTNDTSLPSPRRANNVGGSAALHAAASWGASEVALPERSPAAAACNLLRPQTSTAFKDSQPRPVARVVALPPLLPPPPPSCSVLSAHLDDLALAWHRGSAKFPPPSSETSFPLGPSTSTSTSSASRLLPPSCSHCYPIPHPLSLFEPVRRANPRNTEQSWPDLRDHDHDPCLVSLLRKRTRTRQRQQCPRPFELFCRHPLWTRAAQLVPSTSPSFCDSECDGICRFTLGV